MKIVGAFVKRFQLIFGGINGWFCAGSVGFYGWFSFSSFLVLLSMAAFVTSVHGNISPTADQACAVTYLTIQLH